MKKFAVLAFLAAAAVATAHASENAVRQAFSAKFPKYQIDTISRNPTSGLYEIIAEGHAFYTDEKLSYIIVGELFDTRAQPPRNVTQESLSKVAAAALTKSADLAIKRVRGNGKRVIYTFEDPNCGYCRELQKELVKVRDVTIYTYLWAILSQDSIDKSQAIWCAKDRAKAWDDLMLKGVPPGSKRDCETPLERNSQLAQRLGLRGTPGVFLINGQQIGGYVSADNIEAALAAR
jgi:thiol:disulfide interchange protein DsbC